jgi:rhodanese-related sulfurtransferase
MTNNFPLETEITTVSSMLDRSEDFLLLDVREQDEYDVARIEGSLLIPMSELGGRVSELEPHRDRLIVVQCHHGVRSLQVTHALRNHGFEKVQSMTGGIDQWSQLVDTNVPRY